MLDALLGPPGRGAAAVRDKLECVAEPDESGRVHRRASAWPRWAIRGPAFIKPHNQGAVRLTLCMGDIAVSL
ncbi:hypothetical protein SO3561_08627 [Streptomyces olivochromogenes]|uniref:Uncharacterized protein n=1 Tax=Streptomyces olivochromogenes TaxID=1963 RepID=A0A250VS74_STROL|nr:hypothetical protein SO3561_08627 [Streptomyces olivochromogenes]